MLSWPLLPFLLILFGLVLLVVEVFVPSGGVFFILSILSIIFGVVLVFFNHSPTEGAITLIALFLIIPIIVGVSFHFWPRTRIGKIMMLQGPEEDHTMATMPELQELERLVGQIGKAVTAMRPSGVALIQGRRIECHTEGMFCDAGQWVRVIDVRAGHVTVRPLMDDEIGKLHDLTM